MRIETFDLGCEVRPSNGERLAHCPVDLTVSLIRQYGYVMFAGFDPSIEEYEGFTNRFGTCADTRHVHYPESGAALGFHAEDAYNPYRPDGLWFFCAHEGSDGGIPTGVVDGVELLEALPARWQAFARTTRMRFDRQWEPGVWHSAEAVRSRQELAEVLEAIPTIEHSFLPHDYLYIGNETPLVTQLGDGRESFSNTLLQAVADWEFYGMSLSDGSPVPEEFLRLVVELAQERERDVGWRTGDVAVIDNLRMMHRRREYRQNDRDLRARHCEDLFQTQLPEVRTSLQAWTKSLIQGDVAIPTRVGRPETAPTEPPTAANRPSA